MLRCALLIAFSLCIFFSKGQTCTNPGQNPQTAFPVCGTNTFTQNSVPLCGNRNMVGPCGNVGLTDKNPYWYKFTCFTTGTLGFLINPQTSTEDYDWQLFDVTGVTNLDAVYTNPALFVTCSWSGFGGSTGASAAGTVAYACEGNTPLFTRMPTITAGNNYLLMISHYTNTQSGYNLTFGGGTASITDPLASHLTGATAACDGIHINIKLNKRMQCNSLAANGSDFSINTGVSNIISATGFGCATGFDLDSIQLTLNNPLPAGTYRIKAKIGNDQNTLLDICGTPLAVGDSIDLVVPAQLPVPMDSVRVQACSPQNIYLEFKDFIRCNTIAANGSDFSITGPTGVTIVGAAGTCNAAGLTKTVKVSLSVPIQIGGMYTINLLAGNDGNTLLNDCNQATPVGSALSFMVRDSLSAAFTYNVSYNACAARDTVRFSHPGNTSISLWNWTFIGGTPLPSNVPRNQTVTYPAPGVYSAILLISNGFCRDSVTLPITINSVPKDSVLPKLATAIAPCEGTQIFIKLNKKIKCSSIAANGSDFRIRPALATITNAQGINCGTTAETDSILLTLGSPLPSGTYTLLIGNGNDGNTLLDNCNRTIPVNDSINNISVVLHSLVTMDSISKAGCKPNEIFLYFKEPVLCSSIAANGSDFGISVPTGVTITQAAGTCNNGFTNSIKLTLNASITTAGTYSVVLKNGTDGNTLLNECNKAALPNASLPFVTGDTTSAVFTYSVAHSCLGRDTVSFFHNGQNGVTQWRWSFDNGVRSSLQNPVINYSTYGTRPVNLMVTNGFCTDSSTQQIFIASDTLHVSFEAPSFLCPSEQLNMINRSTGNITSYVWNFGDGTIATTATPPMHIYPIPLSQMEYSVKLMITGSLGCSIDTTVKVKALNNCVIAVPTAFTPNGDGLNDYLYPTNAFKADKLSFKVFSRLGQPIFEARNMTQKWDGKVNGNPQPTGAYVWFLNYIDTDTGKPVSLKGTTLLIR